MLIRCILLNLLLLSLNVKAVSGIEARPLFDGLTLQGWEKKGGNATFNVVDGVIVGQSAPNTENSFLCTKKSYGDFILEFEFQCDNKLNSGVQIRSNCYDQDTTLKIRGRQKNFPAGRVHGYQIEIDPNKPQRLWIGGIYDEARRGWLYPGIAGGDGDKFTKQGIKFYQPEQWNSIHVECQGDRVRTWLNGQLRADFRDDLTTSGFIALQVHGVGSRTEPLTVRWRNLTIQE